MKSLDYLRKSSTTSACSRMGNTTVPVLSIKDSPMRSGNSPEYLTKKDCCRLTEVKSGYHQLKVHTETYPFMGIEVGEDRVLIHIPPLFGLYSACQVYIQTHV